jgi:flagellar biosynthetic protein FlhB
VSDQSEKTEKPTPKKLRETKEEGRTARSKDATIAVTSLAATGILVGFGPSMVGRLTVALAGALTGLGPTAHQDLQPEDMTVMIINHGAMVALLVGPIAIAAVIVSVGTAAAQGGIHFAPKALRLDLTRLNPANGLKRLAPSQSWIDMLKTLVTACVLGVIAYQSGKTLAISSVRFPWMSPVGSAGAAWDSAAHLMWQAGFALLALGVGDYGLQRWRLMKSIKMSVQDIRDEARSSEGSPETKQRMRRVQRDMSRKRMLQDAAHATVVITNPTHYAVALEYNRQKSPAPIVVAKGKDLLAQRIREIARKNSVPIIENPPLARALHATAEVGDTIPGELFGAVAEVLGYLIRIKQLTL